MDEAIIMDTKSLMNYFSNHFLFDSEDDAKRFKVYFVSGVGCGTEDDYYALSELYMSERLSVARKYKPVMMYVEVEILKTRYNVYYKTANETKRETVMLKTSDVDSSVHNLVRLLEDIFLKRNPLAEQYEELCA